MNDIQVIDPAQQILRALRNTEILLYGELHQGGHTTWREGSELLQGIGQLRERPPSPVYNLWQRVKSGEAEPLHVR